MNNQFSEDDKKFMRMALDVAETGIGKTDFAPSIGCVIVKDGEVIGKGRFAQRLASRAGGIEPPEYIKNAIAYVVNRV